LSRADIPNLHRYESEGDEDQDDVSEEEDEEEEEYEEEEPEGMSHCTFSSLTLIIHLSISTSSLPLTSWSTRCDASRTLLTSSLRASAASEEAQDGS
jgi:hypothetical protein